MMEGAFYQQKRGSPTALTIVLLMHGAAITALALTKMEVVKKIWDPPIVVTPVPVDEPPPPEPTPQSETPPTQSVITHVPPVIEMPPRPIIAPTEPLPPTPPAPVVRTEPPPIPVAKADPPPPAKKIEPARAKANLASYVSDEDYPTTAVRNEEQGTTRFRLVVAPDGKVRECSVTSSSGSSALDATTCRLMKQRARFTPARDSDGRATGDTVASAIRWVLPTD
jgi:protein TonB